MPTDVLRVRFELLPDKSWSATTRWDNESSGKRPCGQLPTDGVRPRDAGAADKLGGKLFNFIFSDVSARRLYDLFSRLTQESPDSSARRIRKLLIELPWESSELDALPWELLYDKKRQHSLHYDGFCIVRAIWARSGSGPSDFEIEKSEPPTQALVLLENLSRWRRGYARLSPDREVAALKVAFSAARIEVAKTLILPNHQRAGVSQDALIHVISHGEMRWNGTDQLPALVGRDDALFPEQFAAIVPRAKLIFINSCHSGSQALSTTYSLHDFPRQLFQEGHRKADFLICNPVAVYDQLASRFAAKFYHALGEGRSFLESVWYARESLRQPRATSSDWAIPAVYIHKTLDFRYKEFSAQAPDEDLEHAKQRVFSLVDDVLQTTIKKAYRHYVQVRYLNWEEDLEQYYRDRADADNQGGQKSRRFRLPWYSGDPSSQLLKARNTLLRHAKRLRRRIVGILAQQVSLFDIVCRGLAAGFLGTAAGIVLFWLYTVFPSARRRHNR
jgi:hypothetical protein